MAVCFCRRGLSFFGLKDYSQRQGLLSVEQERATQAHFTEQSARNADEVCAYILAEHDQSYSASGAAKLMRRLGFVCKKPQSLPAQADEIKQAAFIAHYEALMTGLSADEMVVFSDAMHPEHQSRTAHGWFPKTQKIALKATSGRKRLNIQGALDLETFQFTFVESEKINGQTIQQMLGTFGSQEPNHDGNSRLSRQCTLPSRHNIAAMVGEIRATGKVTFPAAICAASQSNRTSLGRHA